MVALPEPLTSQEERLISFDTLPHPLRIAFTGPAGSGKTTHATLMRQRFKGDVLSFASPIKKMTRDVFGDRMDDAQFARSANQEFGVLARRLAGPNIWVEKLLEKVSESRNCFVDDCRFQSEYNALRAKGFLFVKLVAPPTTLAARRPNMTHDQWNHESELELAMSQADIYMHTEDVEPDEVNKRIISALQALNLSFPSFPS